MRLLLYVYLQFALLVTNVRFWNHVQTLKIEIFKIFSCVTNRQQDGRMICYCYTLLNGISFILYQGSLRDTLSKRRMIIKGFMNGSLDLKSRDETQRELTTRLHRGFQRAGKEECKFKMQT